MGATPELVVAPSAAQLADDVAARLVATLVSVQGVRPLAHLVVTAGGILERVIGALGESPARDSIDWSRVGGAFVVGKTLYYIDQPTRTLRRVGWNSARSVTHGEPTVIAGPQIDADSYRAHGAVLTD